MSLLRDILSRVLIINIRSIINANIAVIILLPPNNLPQNFLFIIIIIYWV